MCAQHELLTPNRKVSKNFKITNKVLNDQKLGNLFQRVQVPYARESCLEALASGKVVYREVCTEGSQTAKSGTDEQKRYKRLYNEDKQAHHCNVQRVTTSFYSRYRRNWMKE